jgi:diguanylate cyclase (GGDEF)-like protein/PAS domain S-box-containing protein
MAAVLLAGAGLTTIVAGQRAADVRRGNDARIARSADAVVDELQRRVTTYVGLLDESAAFYRSSTEVTPAEWDTWTSSLDLGANYPGVESIAFVAPVPAEQLDAFVSTQRAWGRADFAVRPAGARDEYFVIALTSPDAAPLGLDFAASGERAGLEEARDSGRATRSGRLSPAGQADDPGAAGVIALRRPVYAPGAPVATPEQRRQASVGWMNAQLRLATLLDRFDGEGAGLGIELFDGGSVDGTRLDVGRASPDGQSVVRTFDLVGRPVTLRATPTGALVSSVGSETWLIVALGGVATAAAAGLALLLSSQRQRLARTAIAAQDELRRTEAEFTIAFENTDTGIALVDARFRVVRANPALARMTGRTAPELEGASLEDVLGGDRPAVTRDLALVQAGRGPTSAIVRLVRPDGSTRWAKLHLVGIARGDAPPTMFAQIEDVTDQRALEQRLADERRFLRAVLDNVDAGIAACDQAGNLTLCNPAARRLHGGPAIDPDDAVAGDPVRWELADGTPLADRDAPLRRAMRGEHVQGLETVVRAPDGEPTHLLVNAQAIDQADSGVAGAVVVYHDITPRKRYERELQSLALLDQLTGLPNRRLLADRLTKALDRARRHLTTVAVLFIDLDRFKQVNDSLGHAAGDEVLRAGATRLTGAVRAADTAARFGGDEFVVVAEDIADLHAAEEVANRARAAICRPVQFAGLDIAVEASIGIELAGPGDTPDSLLQRADRAMYRAKGRLAADIVVDLRAAPAMAPRDS